MDGQLTGLALIGIAVGVKVVGSFIARRRGPRARERWESLTDGFRVRVVRFCLTLGASLFWGAAAAIAVKYLAQYALSLNISQDGLFALALLDAICIFIWLYPKASKIIS